MGRSIVTAAATVPKVATRGGPDQDFAPPARPVDGYADRLVKLIPTEVIGVYFSMVTLLRHSKDTVAEAVPWLVFGFGAMATLFYLRVTLKVLDPRQLSLSVVAFCVWAFTIGEPFSRYDWYNGTYAGLLLIAYTFVAPQVPMGQPAGPR
jgi:hypothetical protein